MYSIYVGFNKRMETNRCFEIVKNYFENFTLYPVIGCYKGKKVKTIKIEIETKDERRIYHLARELSIEFKQKEVLIKNQ